MFALDDPTVPTGVQIIAGRFKEELCLRAGAMIEAQRKPMTPNDPR